MAKPRALDVEEHLPFLRREWAVQRIGRGLLAGFVLLAVVGVFGSGLASRATLSAPDFELRYSRFVRTSSESELVVTMTPDRPGPATVWLSQAYLDTIDVRGIRPAPESVHSADGRTEFRFSAAGPLRVVFRIVPQDAGRIAGEIGRRNGPGHAFRQIVYF